MKIPKVPVIIVRKGTPSRGKATVIPETSMTVTLNDEPILRMQCRPENPEEVAVGMLLDRGLVDAPDRLKALRVYPARAIVAVQARRRPDESSDGKGLPPSAPDGVPVPLEGLDRQAAPGRAPPFPPPVEETKTLCALAETFLEEVEVKGIFGAYDVAALGHARKGIFCRAADVDIPVTVDRLLGKAFLAGLDARGKVLLLSGRLRYDTARKAALHGIRTVVSAEAVTRLALEEARRTGLRVACVDEEGTFTVFGPEEKNLPEERETASGEG